MILMIIICIFTIIYGKQPLELLVQQEAQVQREQAAKEIEQQKQAAMATLDAQVDALSNQILEKLLGSALAK